MIQFWNFLLIRMKMSIVTRSCILLAISVSKFHSEKENQQDMHHVTHLGQNVIQVIIPLTAIIFN